MLVIEQIRNQICCYLFFGFQKTKHTWFVISVIVNINQDTYTISHGIPLWYYTIDVTFHYSRQQPTVLHTQTTSNIYAWDIVWPYHGSYDKRKWKITAYFWCWTLKSMQPVIVCSQWLSRSMYTKQNYGCLKKDAQIDTLRGKQKLVAACITVSHSSGELPSNNRTWSVSNLQSTNRLVTLKCKPVHSTIVSTVFMF